MANPFLVLGGIAVGIVTAAFGVLAVPGWVAAAQDAAAVNDVSHIASAQAAAISQSGQYAGTLASLNDTDDGIQVTGSQGVQLLTSTDSAGAHAVYAARSASGRYFARLSGSTTTGSGAELEAAVINAGTTVSGPAHARVTAEGVVLPAPSAMRDVQYRNLFGNSDLTTAQGIEAYWGAGNNGIRKVVKADWTHSGNAVRMTPTTGSGTKGHFDIRPAQWMEQGKRYTIVWEMVGSGTFTSLGQIAGYPAVSKPVASSPAGGAVVGSTPRKLWATFDMDKGPIDRNWQAYAGMSIPNGQWVEFGNVQMYEGDYDPDRPWFSGTIIDPSSSLDVAWEGAEGDSTAYAYR